MKYSIITILATALPVLAQTTQSLCDKYSQALFNSTSGSNQYTLLTKLVNTALIGNYTPGAKNVVTGILVAGDFNGTAVNLLPYFNGGLISTNRNLSGNPSSVNFLDDGGAIALANDKPADGTNSNQYRLITHLYQFFGAVLGCSSYGKDGFTSYQGNPRMYEVHKFMNTDPNELGYFVEQIGLAALSFGVTEAEATTVANTLNTIFGQRCSPPAAVLPSAQPDLQAICINSACPQVTQGAVCSRYNRLNNGVGIQPATASTTPGPQATALAVQLSSITASVASAASLGSSAASSGASSANSAASSGISGAGGVVTISGNATITQSGSTTTSGFTSTGILSSMSTSVQTVVTTSGTSDGSTFTSTYTSTVSSAQVFIPISVSSMMTTVTSGSATVTTEFASTTIITESAASIDSSLVNTSGNGNGNGATSTSSRAAGATLCPKGAVAAVVGMAAAAVVLL